jgi:hypothetical protein
MTKYKIDFVFVIFTSTILLEASDIQAVTMNNFIILICLVQFNSLMCLVDLVKACSDHRDYKLSYRKAKKEALKKLKNQIWRKKRQRLPGFRHLTPTQIHNMAYREACQAVAYNPPKIGVAVRREDEACFWELYEVINPVLKRAIVIVIVDL